MNKNLSLSFSFIDTLLYAVGIKYIRTATQSAMQHPDPLKPLSAVLSTTAAGIETAKNHLSPRKPSRYSLYALKNY
jgi:hypothetical protein